jgi:hypothetical protein
MNDEPPASARDALIAEALGEVASLLDRVDALVAALDSVASALNEAGAGVEAKAAAFEASTAALVDASKRHLVSHVATKTQETIQAAGDAQMLAIREELRALIRTETPAPARHGSQTDVAQRGANWTWTAHVATAICASLLTAALVAYLQSS